MKFLTKIDAMNLVVASPMICDPTEFKFDDRKINHVRYVEYRKRAATLLHPFTSTIGLYRLSRHFIVKKKKKKRILYFVRFSTKMILGHKFAVQEILWRDSLMTKDQFKINGQSIGAFVFFEHLLSIGDGVGIATDSMQTPGGKRFWFDRVAQAFDRGLYIYLIDQNTRVKVAVADDEDFKTKVADMKTWTDTPAGEGRRVIISLKKLW